MNGTRYLDYSQICPKGSDNVQSGHLNLWKYYRYRIISGRWILYAIRFIASERFNGAFRREFLDAYLFQNLNQVRDMVWVWQEDYNNARQTVWAKYRR